MDMTTGPPPSKYPKVSVTRADPAMTYTLEPDAVGWGDKNVHIARLEHIGTLAPGAKNEVIHFRPLEKTEWPLRLVSLAITPENNNNKEKFAGYGEKYSKASTG